jgi:lysozyme
MLRGVDVSSVQGSIDWTRVAASGVRFAIIKCSTGNDTGVDSRFTENVANARAAGLVVGAYHFAYPLPNQAGNPSRDPAEQAQIAFEKSGGLGAEPGDLPPALDLEWPAPQDWAKWRCTAAQIRDWGLAYLDKAHSLWGCAPLVYTYPDFWQHLTVAGGLEEYGDYPLWIADYAKYGGVVPPDDAAPRSLPPWADWTFWQHDGNRGLLLENGMDADFNVFNGDEVTLASLTGSAGTNEVFVQPD